MPIGSFANRAKAFIRRLQRRIIVGIIAAVLLALGAGFAVATLYQLLRLVVSAPAATAILTLFFFGLAALTLAWNPKDKDAAKSEEPTKPEDPVDHLLQTFVAGVRAGRSAAAEKKS